MFKLLFCIILFLNLEPSQSPNPNYVFTGRFVKLIPVHQKVEIENSPQPKNLPSTVEMPKQDHTQEHAMSIRYQPLVVKVSPFGAFDLPVKVEEYFADPEQSIPSDTVSELELFAFFCPPESAGKPSCLLPTILHLCNVPPEPVIVPLIMEVYENKEAEDLSNSAGKNNDGERQSSHMVMKLCGPSGEGKMYGVIFRLCWKADSDGQITEETEYEVYNFCYDHKKRETIFAQYMISSPEKLNESEEIPFLMSTKDDGYFENDFKIAEAEYSTPRSDYKPQKLVSPDDMAQAASQISTFHFLNVRYQHASLIELWNKIGILMLESAAAKQNDTHLMYVGAFTVSEDKENVEFVYENNISIPDIWIKLLIVKDIYNDKKARALAVLMNNVPKDSNLGWKWGGELCPKNFCDIPNRKDTFFIGLTDVGHNVRCCKVTKKIMMFFNLDKKYNEYDDIEVFEIDNLTD